MSRPDARPAIGLERILRVHIAAAILSGLAVAALVYGPLRLAVAVNVLVAFAQLYSLEQLRAAIRNPEILR